MYMTVEHVYNNGNAWSIPKLCSFFSVSRSGYYYWKGRKEKQYLSNLYEMQLKKEIQNIVLEFSGYGYRRVMKELHRRGLPVNSKRVRRLMKEDNLLCIRRKFKPVTTNSNHRFQVYPNLVKKMNLTGINQLWVSDITYIQLVKEFIYLAVIIDVFSRKCIGWELDRSIDTQLTLNALNQALKTRWSKGLIGLVHHSDQGVQYASQAYVDYLRDHSIQISMSRKGNPYDNAFAESFIKTLKYEEVYLKEYDTFSEAYKNVENFIEEVYNKKRLHSSIGYLPPDEFERAISLNTLA